MLGRWKERFPFFVNSSYATASAGSAGLLLILLALAARYLSPDDYGRFRFALALTSILETIMDIGLGHVTVRAVARNKADAGPFFRNILGLKLVWVGVGLALLGIVTPMLRSDPIVIRVCYLMGLSSAVRSYLVTTRGLLQGLDRFDTEAWLVVSDRVLLLLAGSAALVSGYGLMGLVLAFVAARTLVLAGVIVLLRTLLGSIAPTFDRAAWRELQAAAIPLGLFMIVLNTYSYIDTVILGVMRSDAEVGRYGAAYSVYEGLTYVPSVLAAVLTPRLSELFTRDRQGHRRLLGRVLSITALLGVVLGAAAMWTAPLILETIFGAAYLPGSASLQILAAGSVFVFCTWILHAAAISTNLDRRLLVTTAVGLSTNVALNLALIPRWGINGAAAATVIAEGLTAVLLLVQIQRRLSA